MTSVAKKSIDIDAKITRCLTICSIVIKANEKPLMRKYQPHHITCDMLFDYFEYAAKRGCVGFKLPFKVDDSICKQYQQQLIEENPNIEHKLLIAPSTSDTMSIIIQHTPENTKLFKQCEFLGAMKKPAAGIIYMSDCPYCLLDVCKYPHRISLCMNVFIERICDIIPCKDVANIIFSYHY